MLSYRHHFHAGNFADVMKHAVLTLLVQSLQHKDKGFAYLDTHAGVGRYDLQTSEAQQTLDYQNGIARLYDMAKVPQSVGAYLNAVRQFNNFTKLRFYPGSPRLVRSLLRPQDRMTLVELHPTDIKLLGAEFLNDKQVVVYHQDGYQGIKAFLPPAERRGLVLIDPAFELKTEWKSLVAGLQEGWRRWPTGMYALWYPIQERAEVKRFYRQLSQTDIPKILAAELCIYPDDTAKNLNGSGMVIVNPPHQLEKQLRTMLRWLWENLSVDGQGGSRVEWLVPE